MRRYVRHDRPMNRNNALTTLPANMEYTMNTEKLLASPRKARTRSSSLKISFTQNQPPRSTQQNILMLALVYEIYLVVK
jgi:hypothetical protein